MTDQPKAVTQSDTDVAALSAGVIAVAVTTIVTPGRYGGMGTILTLTLLILIISYSWNGSRTLAHSIAFSAVIGLIGMEIVAVIIEAYLSPHPKELFIGSDYESFIRDAAEKARLKNCIAASAIPDWSCPSRLEALNQLELFGQDEKTRVRWNIYFSFVAKHWRHYVRYRPWSDISRQLVA